MSMQSTPPIFVVNLKRHTDRRQHITQELQKLALPYRMIEAVDGQLLSDDEIQKVYSEEGAIKDKSVKRPLSKSEIACALSHQSIYKIMLAEDIEQAIILEDDAVLNQQFIETAQAAQKLLPNDWQLLLLGYGEFFDGKKWQFHEICQIQIAQSLSADLKITLPLSIAYCTFAYLINQSGARQLLEQIQPLSRPIDHYTGDHKMINVYCVEPRCVLVNTALQSTLMEYRKEIATEYTLQSKTHPVKQWLKQNFYFVLILVAWRNNITCIIKKMIYYLCDKRARIETKKND